MPVYQMMLPQHLLSSPSPLCGPVMLGDIPALLDFLSQRLEWTSLELAQQMFLFNVSCCTIMVPTFILFLPHAVMLPPPIVSPTQGISVEAGGQDTITCTALFDEYLVERPTLVWEFPQGSGTDDTTMGDQLGIQGTTNRTLTFNRIRTSQAGVYTCRATIDIQGIDSPSQTASQTIRVQSKLSM